MLDTVLSTAIAAAFGAAGYFIVEFFIGPQRAAVRRYQELRWTLISDLIFDANGYWDESKFPERSVRIRRHSCELEALHREILPKWYLRKLASRKIDLKAAAASLRGVSNSVARDARLKAKEVFEALQLGDLMD